MSFSNEQENFIKLVYLLREATVYIREKFLKTWVKLNRTDWLDSDTSADYFTKGDGEIVYKQMSSLQKKLVEMGDSTFWDISIFDLIFSHAPFNKSNYTSHIGLIKDAQMKIDKSINLKISNEDFSHLWSVILKSLKSLGYSNNEVDAILKNFYKEKQSSFEIEFKNEEAKMFKELGNKYFNDKNFEKSIELYSKALNEPDLSNIERAILLCNRSFAYLKSYDISIDKNKMTLIRALVDAEAARCLNPVWYKVYYRLGQIYQELNAEKSIENFNKGLVLYPESEEIKNALAFIKYSNFDQTRNAHLDEHYQPFTTEEREKKFVDKLKSNVGIKIDESLEDLKKISISCDKTLEDVWKGHDYRDGSNDIKQNYEMAAKYYSKAAQNGNAEGMYNLALLTLRGRGVKLDYKLGINLLKQAANQPPKRMLNSIEIPNVGVAEAEHSLGIAYQEGTYVSQSYPIALYWYQRAVDHENDAAANNLGVFYMNGMGVDRDLDRAEKLFLLSHKRGCNDSITNLVDLYILKNDPDRALLWHKRAIENNSIYDINRNEDVEEQINRLKIYQKEEKILFKEFEKKGQLNEFQKYKNVFKKINENKNMIKEADTPRNYYNEMHNLDMLKEYSEKGSKTASRMLETITNFNEAINEFSNHQNSYNYDFSSVFEKMSKAYQKEHSVCRIPMSIVEFILKEIKKILNRKKIDDLDLNARICYMHLKLTEYQSTIDFINDSLPKYRNNKHMFYIRGSLYSFLKKNDKALKDFLLAYEIDKTDYDKLYSVASTSRILGKYKEAIKNYKLFLDRAPKDHRKVPESLYAIGVCEIHSKIGKPKDEKEKLHIISLIEEYLKKGEDAEKLQLPYYLPYESNNKIILKNYQIVSDAQKDTSSLNQSISESNDKKVDIQNDDLRIQIIKKHRASIQELIKFKKSNLYCVKNTFKPPKKQKMPYSTNGFKPIYLKEIDFTKDKILDGHFINLKIFDIPLLGLSSVHFIVEDQEKSVERMCVYNLGEDYDEIKEIFKVGTEFSLVNPYIRMALDNKPIIRVDDPNTIKFTGQTIQKMCRYCGNKDSKYNCTKCSNAFYCSKECQENDWKLLDHKLICF